MPDSGGAADSYVNQTGGPPPGGANQQPTRGNPIGVPKYQIDPTTGLALTDSSGNPVPWITQGAVTAYTKQQPGSFNIPAPYQTTGPVTARYYDGDEWAIVGNMPPEIRVQVQQAMKDRGLYSSANPRIAPGAWDNDSATAFKQVLAYANSSGTTWDQALKQMPKMDDTQQQKVRVQQPHVFSPFTATLTNPTDLKAVLKAGARSALGRQVSDDEVNQFVNQYQAQQLAVQRQQYGVQHAAEEMGFQAADQYDAAQAAAAAGQDFTQPAARQTPAGGVFTNPASPSNAAEEFARNAHPAEAGAHDIARTFDQFSALLGGILGQANTAGSA